MKKLGWIIAVIVVAAIIIFVTRPSSGGTGTLRMQITDAPSSLNISKALVTISEIQVHAAGSEGNETNTTGTNTTNSTTAGWFRVVSGPVTYDLINITDVKQFLGSSELAAGKYTQIRLSVDSAKVTIDGKEYTLTVPSDKLKLVHEFTIKANKTTTLTLDFDANASVIKQGNNAYRLQPTIKVIQEG